MLRIGRSNDICIENIEIGKIQQYLNTEKQAMIMVKYVNN
jgi:hypothetical protein